MLTQGDLRPYQRQAVDHLLACSRAHLFADMGLGKTAATLTAFEIARLAGDAQRMLVIAPLRVAQNVWPREPGKWEHLQHLRVQPILGAPRDRSAAILLDADVYTINFENLIWLVEYWGKRWPYDWVVSDEATRLKKPSGKRFRAAKKIHKLPARWTGLTGTPAPNGLLDLWAPTYLLDSGWRLGKTFGGFKSRWFDEDYMGYSATPRPTAEKEIRNTISDITLSIRAEDHLSLRELQVQTVSVTLPGYARRIYRDMERTMLAEIAGQGVEAVNAGVVTLKCRQIASGAAYVDDAGNWEHIHDAKIDALRSVIEEAAGEPVLVAYHFRSTADRVVAAIPGARKLDAGPTTVDEWNAGKIPVLCIHPASAGHGLDLQHGGRRIVFADADWDLELHQQVIERIGPTRQMQSGYDRLVYVYHLTATGTVDEAVEQRLRGKASTQKALTMALRRGYSR